MSEAALREAKRLHLAGQIAEAVRLYRDVLRSAPAHWEALYGLGMAEAQSGRLGEGEALLARAVAARPGFAEGWRARAMMQAHLGRHGDALQSFDRALALKPGFKQAEAGRAALLAERPPAGGASEAQKWNDRGSVLAASGQHGEALQSLERALTLEPDYVEARCNRATLLFEMGRLDASLEAFDAVLRLEPDLAIAWNNRGNVLTKLGRFEEALNSYDKALAILPGFAEAQANRELPLFELGRVSRSPANYMRGLFDGFSARYDKTMLKTLAYRGHVQIRTMADCVLSDIPRPLYILDLGCGTGLVGEALRDLRAERLDGIDLSPRMIAYAKERGLYNTLTVGDIETWLNESGLGYGLIVSADTLTYLGNLAPVFDGVARRLAPGGFFLFTSEAKDGDGWEKTPTHRYRHSEAYVRELAARVGLVAMSIERCALRLEESVPVEGLAVTLRKV